MILLEDDWGRLSGIDLDFDYLTDTPIHRQQKVKNK